MGQGYWLFRPCWNLPTGHCGAGVQAVEGCQNLHVASGHCGAGVQAV